MGARFVPTEISAKTLAVFPSPAKPAGDAAGEGGDLEQSYEEFLGRQHEPPTLRETEDQNAMMLRRQRHMRAAAEYLADELALVPEVVRVALFGSVAQPLKKEIPRFTKFRHNRVAVWLNAAMWIWPFGQGISRVSRICKGREGGH